jgi:hypothetical protein
MVTLGRRWAPWDDWFDGCTVHHRTSIEQGLPVKWKPFLFLVRKKYEKSTKNGCSIDSRAAHSIANGSARSDAPEDFEPVRFFVVLRECRKEAELNIQIYDVPSTSEQEFILV